MDNSSVNIMMDFFYICVSEMRADVDWQAKLKSTWFINSQNYSVRAL